jgi:hypothetical protein
VRNVTATACQHTHHVAALTSINPAASLRGTITNHTLSMSVNNTADSGIPMVLEGAGTMVVDVGREQVSRAREQSPRGRREPTLQRRRPGVSAGRRP